MSLPLLRSIRLDGFLSFAPQSVAVDLQGLNVLIGPNGSGKSNFLEAISVLSTLPAGDKFQSHLRSGGGVGAWSWKADIATPARIEIELNGDAQRYEYGVAFTPSSPNAAAASVLDEVLLGYPNKPHEASTTYFRFKDQQSAEVSTRALGPDGPGPYELQVLKREYLLDTTSLLSQFRNAGAYPDLNWVARKLETFAEFREWTFGRSSHPRFGGQTDAPSDSLTEGGRNLAMMVQELSHRGRLGPVNDALARFLPRFERLTTRVSGGTIGLFLHEDGFAQPFAATRLSDGTLRFLSLLVALHADPAPPVMTIEEPELGLHPDALTLVAEVLIEASARTQIFVTTHSDALVSALTGHIDSVLVCEHLGGSRLRRLDAAAMTHWLDDYRLGDLWRMGELGGNP